MWQFLVEWKGLPQDQNTWEPKTHFETCPELLETFEKQLALQREKRAKQAGEPTTTAVQPNKVVNHQNQTKPNTTSLSPPQTNPSQSPTSVKIINHNDKSTPTSKNVAPATTPEQKNIQLSKSGDLKVTRKVVTQSASQTGSQLQQQHLTIAQTAMFFPYFSKDEVFEFGIDDEQQHQYLKRHESESKFPHCVITGLVFDDPGGGDQSRSLDPEINDEQQQQQHQQQQHQQQSVYNNLNKNFYKYKKDQINASTICKETPMIGVRWCVQQLGSQRLPSSTSHRLHEHRHWRCEVFPYFQL